MRCPDCQQDKPEDDFPRHRNRDTGRGLYCKPCHNARTRATVKRLYGDSRHYHFRQKYGIDIEDYERMVAEQHGLCLVCGKRPAKQVDHDHATGKVRGILCLKCNAALGAFKDNVVTMGKAIEYLKNGGSGAPLP